VTSHATISPLQAADRLAIRELIDAYARCADRRDAKGQMALFTDDIRFGSWCTTPPHFVPCAKR
jgi:SnoaL-like domain